METITVILLLLIIGCFLTFIATGALAVFVMLVQGTGTPEHLAKLPTWELVWKKCKLELILLACALCCIVSAFLLGAVSS